VKDGLERRQDRGHPRAATQPGRRHREFFGHLDLEQVQAATGEYPLDPGPGLPQAGDVSGAPGQTGRHRREQHSIPATEVGPGQSADLLMGGVQPTGPHSGPSQQQPMPVGGHRATDRVLDRPF
jgi:hypothetical protein